MTMTMTMEVIILMTNTSFAGVGGETRWGEEEGRESEIELFVNSQLCVNTLPCTSLGSGQKCTWCVCIGNSIFVSGMNKFETKECVQGIGFGHLRFFGSDARKYQKISTIVFIEGLRTDSSTSWFLTWLDFLSSWKGKAIKVSNPSWKKPLKRRKWSGDKSVTFNF